MPIPKSERKAHYHYYDYCRVRDILQELDSLSAPEEKLLERTKEIIKNMEEWKASKESEENHG